MIVNTTRDPLTDHLGRVLLLIDAFTGSTKLRGLDKLARLDFLLRYPTVLEAALEARTKPMPPDLRPARHERLASETLNMRWQFGPWDARYLPIIGWLVGTRQISAVATSHGLSLATTADGRNTAAALDSEPWQILIGRTKLLRRHLNLSADHLREVVSPLLRSELGGPTE